MILRQRKSPKTQSPEGVVSCPRNIFGLKSPTTHLHLPQTKLSSTADLSERKNEHTEPWSLYQTQHHARVGYPDVGS